jgi:hypothetical protein
MNMSSIFNSIVSFLATLSVLGPVLYWVLQKTLEANFAKRLEITKHELQIELQRLSIVYEHQKDSFRAILSAMHEAMSKIEDKIEEAGGEWHGIPLKSFSQFKHRIAEERLFIDAKAERAISLFTNILWDAVELTSFDQTPDSDEIRRSYDQLELVAHRLAEYFRLRVGLVPESDDPLHDTELLEACRLINTINLPKAGMPTKTALAYAGHQSAEELVSLARSNKALLKSELERFRRGMEPNESGTKAFHAVIIKVDWYLKRLSSTAGL